jgi:hypothetical protein
MWVTYRVDKNGNTELMAEGDGHATVKLILAGGKSYNVKITMKD